MARIANLGAIIQKYVHSGPRYLRSLPDIHELSDHTVIVPCSGMVAAWTGYAKGKVETVLIIVALSLLAGILLVPFWMWVLARVYVEIDPLMTLQKIVLIFIIISTQASIIIQQQLRR
ncbi:MAG: hypothetical protein ACXQTD_01575 [Candidatus Syntropharchaeia archaeon]